ncbi:hypothetical protein PG987_000071 [Apiospora arundinis]
MAVSHTLLLEEQLTKVEIETPESWFYFLVRSQHHWVITVIHVRSTWLPVVRNEEITVCDSWSLPCCSEASEKEVKSIRKFYNAQFEAGEWINGGHHRRDPVPKPGSKCQERQDEIKSFLPRQEDESSDTNEQAVDGTALIDRESSITSSASEQGQPQAYATIVNDITDETDVSSVIKKFEDGVGKLALCSSSGGFVSQRHSLPDGESDLGNAINTLSRIRVGNRKLALIEDWILEHLVRCLWILQRKEQPATTNDETRPRHEKSAKTINDLVNATVEQKGPLGLLWLAFDGEMQDDGGVKRLLLLSKRFAIAFLKNEVWIPEDLYLFNPPAMLCKFLHRDYKSLCRDLGLSSLSDYDPTVGVGQFQMIPFGIFQPQIVPSLAWKEKERCWFIAAQTRTDRSSKKRKRAGNASHLTTRATFPLRGQPNARSGAYRDDSGQSSNLAVSANTRTFLTDIDNMSLVPGIQPAHDSDIDFGSIPNIFHDASARSFVPEGNAGFIWDWAADIDESGTPFEFNDLAL